MDNNVLYSNSTIREGNIIIVKNGNKMKVVKLWRHRPVHMFKQKFRLDAAIGDSWGSTFEVIQGHLIKINNISGLELDTDKGTDNRFLVDDGKSQKLSRDDIESLRKQGATGQELVEQLIENSSTFIQKTEYSQAKYIKKKEKKYLTNVTLLKPNTRLLWEIASIKGPQKICNLRLDSLAQLLTMSNARANNRFLVVESCHGLVVGSLMERMGGEGIIVHLFHADMPYRPILEEFDFPPEFHDTLFSFPLKQLGSLNINKPDEIMNTSTVQVTNQREETVDEHKEDDKTEINVNKRKSMQDEEKAKRRLERLAEYEKARQLLLQKNFDGLIIASKYYPSDMAIKLIDFLAPSRPVTIYCQHKEPLLDCYVKLREKASVINLKLSETWFRHIQVLPNRTHPEINMSGCGGYLLTGINVAS